MSAVHLIPLRVNGYPPETWCPPWEHQQVGLVLNGLELTSAPCSQGSSSTHSAQPFGHQGSASQFPGWAHSIPKPCLELPRPSHHLLLHPQQSTGTLQ